MHGCLSRAVLLVAACLPLGHARAQGWGGSVGLASDNVERGYSLTDGRPAWLTDLHYAFDSGWLAGVAAGAERPQAQRPGARVVLYLDRRWRLDDDWSAKAGVAHYDSPWNSLRSRLRYDEANAAIGFRGRWRASIAVSPNAAGYGEYDGYYGPVRTGLAAWAEVTYRQPLFEPLSAEFGLGRAHSDLARTRDYTYANAGLSWVSGDVYVYLAHLWMRSAGSYAAPQWPSWPYAQGAERYDAAWRPITYATPSASKRRWVVSVVWSW